MNLKRNIAFAAIIFCVTAQPLHAQRPTGADVWHVWVNKDRRISVSIRSIISPVANKQGNVGLAVAVWHKGELIFVAGQGLADVEYGVPVTRDTLFQVASVTKAFTGITLLKLWEEGRVDLDAAIQDYVPHFPGGTGAPVTLRYLQAHLGGVRGYRPNERTPDFFKRHYARASDAIELFANDSLAPVGSQPIYSSYGYNLIAAALEGATGRPFPDVLAAKVISPLGLRRTITPDARVPIRNRSRSYTYYSPNNPGVETDTLFRGRDHDYSYNYGGGNLLTTVEDLVQFGRVLLKPGFFQPATRTMLLTPFRPNAIQNFGWVITHDVAQRPVLFTTGDIEAFQAGITVWPEHDLIVAITSNTQGKGSGGAELRRDVPRLVGLHILSKK